MIEKVKYYPAANIVGDKVLVNQYRPDLKDGWRVESKNGFGGIFDNERDAISKLYSLDPEDAYWYVNRQCMELSEKLHDLKRMCRQYSLFDYYKRRLSEATTKKERRYVIDHMRYNVQCLTKFESDENALLPEKAVMELIKMHQTVKIKKLQKEISIIREKRRELTNLRTRMKIVIKNKKING